ncbi:MAG TPA: AraC family transcriptional regulator [Armatimonadota bacterium]|jgi:AraC-like DNA-binding protein
MLPELPSILFGPNRLRRLCRRLMLTKPAISLPGERLVLHDLHTNWIPRGRTIPEHSHSFYEAHIVLSGQSTLTAPQRRVITTAQILLIEPQTPHGWETPDDAVTSFVLWFNLERSFPDRSPLRWGNAPTLLWVVHLLLAEVQENLTGWNDRAAAYLSVLFSRILAFSRNPEFHMEEMEPNTQLEANIHRFLWDNLERPLTVAEVAAHVGMSERTLHRKYHELTGQTVIQRLHKLRIQRAQTLLEESEASLADIGQQVGIPDPAYFCRCFKQQTGMAPHQYRKYMRT